MNVARKLNSGMYNIYTPNYYCTLSSTDIIPQNTQDVLVIKKNVQSQEDG